MIGIGYMIKNQVGGFSPIKFEEYDTYERALEFYTVNKYKLRDKGLYIQLVNSKEQFN